MFNPFVVELRCDQPYPMNRQRSTINRLQVYDAPRTASLQSETQAKLHLARAIAKRYRKAMKRLNDRNATLLGLANRFKAH